MRRLMLSTACLLVLSLIVLPTLVGRLFGRSAESVSPAAPDGPDGLLVRVYFPEAREIKEIPLGEYLKSVVAGEMPSEFETEALKAQMVAARTYTVRRMQRFNGQGNGGCKLNPNADVCADSRTSQAFMTLAQLEEKIGRVAATAYWKRLGQAQAATAGLVLTYRGDLIDPLYHAVSGKLTEDSADYFGTALPYLRPADDKWGAYSPKLHETRQFTTETLAKLLSSTSKTVPATTSVKVSARTASGRVKTVSVGGVSFTGREFRERLGLRSSDFTVATEDGKVVVRTTGDGHGVGMSQYGANGMAMAGKSFTEILQHYYSGVRLVRMFEE